MWINLLYFTLGAICFIIIDAVFDKYIFNDKPVGTLRIDRSDPDDSPYLFLELSTDPRELMKKDVVTLKVSTENYITQK